LLGFAAGAGAAWDVLSSLHTAPARAAASLALWLTLPPTAATTPDSSITGGWRLDPTPPTVAAAAAARMQRGRATRCNELLRAARHGDCLMLVAVLCAGVDVDGAKDECGLSPIMLAAWLGHVPVLKALAWAGAVSPTPTPTSSTSASFDPHHNLTGLFSPASI
jgi:hypothetical protein